MSLAIGGPASVHERSQHSTPSVNVPSLVLIINKHLIRNAPCFVFKNFIILGDIDLTLNLLTLDFGHDTVDSIQNEMDELYVDS